MRALGYERFVMQGGDAGAFVSAYLGHAHTGSIIGVHLTFPVLPGVPNDAGSPADLSLKEKAMAADDGEWDKTAQIHLMVHTSIRRTLAWAKHDSPFGLAA